MSEKDKLWAAQLREWPDSVCLSMRDVYAWCDQAPNSTNKLSRYMLISMALQWDAVVFYRTKPEGGYMGFRYGVNGHEYMSGFTALESS